MKYLLLTGGTGLLGEYLLRDLSREGVACAVIARPRGKASAAERIEEIFRRLETADRRWLPRPIVITGNLHEDDLGLSEEAVGWIAEHCDAVLHNAASLQFVADEKSGEPDRSNVRGTESVLHLCRRVGLERFHHVSTAYVCGLRDGVIREDDPLEPKQAGNDYEASKIAAEALVRAFTAENPSRKLTVYRPAIIVGDHHTGYTSTFHGFYVPLQLAAAIRGQTGTGLGVPDVELIRSLGLTGTERKNYVPVDWVSQVITRGVTDVSGRFVGKTLHLVPQERVSVQEMATAIVASLQETTSAEPPSNGRDPGKGAEQAIESEPVSAASASRRREELLNFFRSQMSVYQAYWRDDPTFDPSTTTSLVPDLPCPRLDHAAMVRLCRYALKTNFGARRILTQERVPSLFGTIPLRSPAFASVEPSPRSSDPCYGLVITGPGGGDFAVTLGNGDHRVSFGTPQRQHVSMRMSRTAFTRIAAGELSLSAAVHRGIVAVFEAGDHFRITSANEAVRALADRSAVASAESNA